jgi:hypothetical protein
MGVQGGAIIPIRMRRFKHPDGDDRITGRRGGVAEWFRQGPAKPRTAVRFRPPPLSELPGQNQCLPACRVPKHLATGVPLRTDGITDHPASCLATVVPTFLVVPSTRCGHQLPEGRHDGLRARTSSDVGVRSLVVPTFKIPIAHLPHPHLQAPWAAGNNQGDDGADQLAAAFRTLGHAIGWGVLIVFSVLMMVFFGFALLHVMNFWSLPGAP